jgi:hypothetical protein
LTPEFREMLSILNAESVEYLIVGAYAMAAHGLPRATGDIDIWVRATPENASRVINALSRFGMRRGTSAADFINPDIIYQIGFAPCRIDLMTSIDGVTFDEAFAAKVMGSLGGMQVPILGRAELLKNKRASGRPKDLADAAWLEQTSGSG